MNNIEQVNKEEVAVFLASAEADYELIACLQQMDAKINKLK